MTKTLYATIHTHELAHAWTTARPTTAIEAISSRTKAARSSGEYGETNSTEIEIDFVDRAITWPRSREHHRRRRGLRRKLA